MAMTGFDIFQNKEIREKMEAAGILPDKCTRIIIDIPCNGACKVYTETLLKKEAIDVVCDIAVTIGVEPKKKQSPEVIMETLKEFTNAKAEEKGKNEN